MNGVIYARYSSDNQREESIEGQLRKRKEFSNRNGITNVDEVSRMSMAKSDEIKAETKKVFKVIRYSNPMSNDVLANIENQIQSEFNAFADAVKNDDITLAKSSANELIVLINDRNKKCKLLK